MISERAFSSSSFDAFWRELLPLLTPRFVALFNEGYEFKLIRAKKIIGPLPIGDGVERNDIVAEFAFRLARAAKMKGLSMKLALSKPSVLRTAENEALALIDRYEGNKPEYVEPLSKAEKLEGITLCKRYESLYAQFPSKQKIQFCPVFQGAGFLDSCEGDIAIGTTLIEVKTTTRKPSGRDIRQMIVYAALDVASGSRRWLDFAIFNPRRATVHKANIDSLIFQLSGGRAPSDVFADIVAFTESEHFGIDRRF